MSKIKAFLYILVKSMTSVKYYQDVLKANKSLTIKYFTTLSLIISIILTVKISVSKIPVIQRDIQNIAVSAKNMYPDDMTVTVKDNKWSINKPEPFIVPMPQQEADKNNNTFKNLFVLYNEGTIDDLDKYSTVLLINSKNILVKETTGFKVYPLGELPNGELTKADFEKVVDKLSRLTEMVPYFFVAVVLIGTFLYLGILRGLLLFVLAAPVWVIGMTTKFKPTYLETLKVTTHTATIPMVIYAISKVVGYEIPLFFWFSFLNMAAALWVIMNLKREGQVSVDVSTDVTNVPKN